MKKGKTKTRVPVQERAVKTRQAIIKSAMVEFGETGYHKTTAISIARGAGVATGTFYIYFKDKKEVLIEIIRQFYHQVTQSVMTIAADKLVEMTDIRDLVHFIVHAFSTAHQIAPKLHREVSAMILLDKDVEKTFRKEEERVYELLFIYLEKLQPKLRIKDLKAASVLIFKLTDEIIHMVQFSDTPVEGERLLAEVEDMLSQYLKQPSP